jgi:hypothetical protein
MATGGNVEGTLREVVAKQTGEGKSVEILSLTLL